MGPSASHLVDGERAPDRREVGAVHPARATTQLRERHAATRNAPWYVVPADNKWFTRVVVAAAIIDALAALDLHYPRIGKAQLQELAAAKRVLLASK